MAQIIVISKKSDIEERLVPISDRYELDLFTLSIDDIKSDPSFLERKQGGYLVIDSHDEHAIESVSSIPTNYQQILIYLNSKTSDSQKQKITEIYKKEKLIAGHIDESLPLEFSYPLFKKKIEANLEDLTQIGKDLNSLVGLKLKELNRVKKLHEKMVPIREEGVRGLNILSKFAAGEGPGGEFLDIIPSGNKVALVLSSTSSYIISTVILGLIDAFKTKGDISLKGLEKLVS